MKYDKKVLSDYYKSPEWAARRSERLRIDDYKCAKCGFTRALEVHHINYERLFHEDVTRDLITLCKQCHDRIELRKAVNDPLNIVEHHFVYFAGKISKGDSWRPYYFSGEIYDMEKLTYESRGMKMSDSMTVTGPFFLSCDHGCYHGEGSHGVGARYGGCMGQFVTEDEVLDICKTQIDNAEILFAYIDCRDCFGTIAEIGYAHAKEKEVVVAFSNEELKKEMWFIDKMQRLTGAVSDKWIKEQLLSRLKKIC